MFGDNCCKAHKSGELKEWRLRAEKKKAIQDKINDENMSSYIQRLLREYRNSDYKKQIVSRYKPDFMLNFPVNHVW